MIAIHPQHNAAGVPAQVPRVRGRELPIGAIHRFMIRGLLLGALKGQCDLRFAVWLGIGVIVGAQAGAAVAPRLKAPSLKNVFAGAVIAAVSLRKPVVSFGKGRGFIHW